MNDARRTLLESLAEHGYRFVQGGFRLASGATSDEYLDCKEALSHPDALVALGETVLARLDERTVAIGGLTMGADPIAMSTAFASAKTGHRVTWFSIRKEPKRHGQQRRIEGEVAPGTMVTIVDDVATSGGSTIQAIRESRAAGLQVVQVIVLVDREEQEGMHNIQHEVGPDVPVSAIFTKSEVRRAWQERQ